MQDLPRTRLVLRLLHHLHGFRPSRLQHHEMRLLLSVHALPWSGHGNMPCLQWIRRASGAMVQRGGLCYMRGVKIAGVSRLQPDRSSEVVLQSLRADWKSKMLCVPGKEGPAGDVPLSGVSSVYAGWVGGELRPHNGSADQLRVACYR